MPAVLKAPFMVAITLIIAFTGGVWSVMAALSATAGLNASRIGPWEAFPQAQTRRADPYARAHRAREGRLLYGSAEGLSFTAQEDGAGEPLNAACRYRLSGLAPAARFWTLYARPLEGAAPAATDRPVALNSRMVLREANGSFTIEVSAAAQPGNWLAVAPDGRFALIFTLFDAPAASGNGFNEIPMPELQKTGCGHA